LEYFKELAVHLERAELEPEKGDSATILAKNVGPPMKRPKIF